MKTRIIPIERLTRSLLVRLARQGVDEIELEDLSAAKPNDHVGFRLVRKPGAFAGYIYREELFPRSVFRQAYDRLKQADEKRGDAGYVRVLAVAAEVGEGPVADVLGTLLREGTVPDENAVRERLAAPASARPALARFEPELRAYDQLLEVGA